MRSQHVTVNGIRMRWEAQGEGFPVVLIHGIPTSPALWRDVIPHIRDARCLAWEMVGYGDSIVEGHGRDISVGRQADYLVHWMHEAGIERAVLVGHDLGGGVAHIAAVRHPGRFAGLVLTNSIGYDSWPIPSVKALRAARGLLQRLPSGALRPVFASFMVRGHDDRKKAREALQIHSKPYSAPGGAQAFVRQIRSLDVRDTLAVMEAIPTLGLPARVVWGTGDRFQKVGYGERFAHELGAPLTRIPGGKHFTPEDHPKEVAEAVNDLLMQIGARRAA